MTRSGDEALRVSKRGPGHARQGARSCTTLNPMPIRLVTRPLGEQVEPYGARPFRFETGDVKSDCRSGGVDWRDLGCRDLAHARAGVSLA